MGGLISQGIGSAKNLDVVTFGSPGGADILDNLQAAGYATQVANYDYSGKMLDVVAQNDPVGNFGDQISGSNVQHVSLELSE